MQFCFILIIMTGNMHQLISGLFKGTVPCREGQQAMRSPKIEKEKGV